MRRIAATAKIRRARPHPANDTTSPQWQVGDLAAQSAEVEEFGWLTSALDDKGFSSEFATKCKIEPTQLRVKAL